MKAIVLVTGGRGGSDFFQGLLDNHNEILQIPGILRINKEFLEIFLNQKITMKLLKNLSDLYLLYLTQEKIN